MSKVKVEIRNILPVINKKYSYRVWVEVGGYWFVRLGGFEEFKKAQRFRRQLEAKLRGEG